MSYWKMCVSSCEISWDEIEEDVVLLERRVRGVEDHRDRVLHLVVELPRQAVVGALGERGHLLELVRLGLVVVEGEVR